MHLCTQEEHATGSQLGFEAIRMYGPDKPRYVQVPVVAGTAVLITEVLTSTLVLIFFFTFSDTTGAGFAMVKWVCG